MSLPSTMNTNTTHHVLSCYDCGSCFVDVKSSSNPLVSVVIPLYNSELTVLESIHSVLGQTYSNLEILVVNDGSTDDGPRLIESIDDSRITIIHQKNRGLAGARNTGIRSASGSIISFLDSDDTWYPSKIQKHVEHLKNSPSVGISYSGSEFIDARSKSLGIYQSPRLYNISPELILCRNPVGNGSCVVVRRQVLDDIRYTADYYGYQEEYWFDEELRQSEDIECWLRMAVKSLYIFEGLPDILTKYRIHSGGLSADLDKQFASWQAFLEKASLYAPSLVQRAGCRAKGYQLRYLSRRAINEGIGKDGIRLMLLAMKCYPAILVEEPGRTSMTIIASIILRIFPKRFYKYVARRAMILIGIAQRVRLTTSKKAA